MSVAWGWRQEEKGCRGRGGVRGQRPHCWARTYPRSDEDIRDQWRGATAPLALSLGNLPHAEGKDESSSLGPNFMAKKQESGQARNQLQVAFEINKAIKLLLFPSVNGKSS